MKRFATLPLAALALAACQDAGPTSPSPAGTRRPSFAVANAPDLTKKYATQIVDIISPEYELGSGPTQVAVMGRKDFDATTVQPGGMFLGSMDLGFVPAEQRNCPNGACRVVGDVNGDGYPDVILFFDPSPLFPNGIGAPTPMTLTLYGTTDRGLRIRGTDKVVIKPSAFQPFSYRQDFNAGNQFPEYNFPGSVTLSANGTQRFLGVFDNHSVALTLDNLGAHGHITVSYDLYVLQSWDGGPSPVGCCFPDFWSLSLGSTQILKTTFSNVGNNQSYPAQYDGTTQNPNQSGATAVNTLGYGFYGDAIYHMSFTLPHTASSAQFFFTGSNLQGWTDEGWGIDNVTVTTTP